ncbi:MAG: FAD-dependent oxidoreductase, partial [Xanthomonadales bacterium]|nr:FAD-dependent oxidoreductase [Xanthomonadales bacterium]
MATLSSARPARLPGARRRPDPMRADPEKLNSETFDVAIVGGGITGAMVAWEASLRGLSVVLLERGDFASGATGTGTRLIHGGFGQWHPRQVQTVRLALQERQYWLFAAPHLVQPLPVLLFPGNRLKHIVHRAAMALHDRMDSESGLPPGRTASPDEIVKALPFAQRRPGGALLRHEASVAFPERLVIAALQGAVARNARVANHVQVAGIQAGKEGLELRFRDRIANCAGKCRARAVVNASGAWADLLATPEDKDGGLSRIARMYLVTPQLSRGFAVANLPAPHQHFVVPWQGHSLIGAATRILAGDPDDAEVDESQIRDLLKDTNQAFPGLNLERENVLHAQASIQAPASASFAGIEVPEIRSHPSVKIISLAGGHLTMARRTAQEIVDRLSDLPSQSIATALPGGNREEPS